MKNNDQPVTKKELDQVLDKKFNQWTNQEILPTIELMFVKQGEKLKQELKKELTKELRKAIREDIKKDIESSKNEIIASNDNLAKEIKKDREEMMAKLMTTTQVEDKFKNHEQRITKLELQTA